MANIKHHNKTLNTSIAKHVNMLEKNVLLRAHDWMKKYRYTAIKYFIEDVRDARKFTIAALTIDNNFPYDKLRYWEEVKAAMNNVECDLEILNANDVNVLSNEECAKFLMEVDTINTMIGRLVKQLTNKLPES